MKHRTGEGGGGGGGGESPLVMGLIRAYTYRSLNYLVSTITFEVFSAPYVYVHACTCIWDSFHKNGPSHIIHVCIKFFVFESL